LDNAGIICNKTPSPFATESPVVPSGIRIGTAAVTTRGMKEPEMKQLGAWIAAILKAPEDEALQASVRDEVRKMAALFPVP
jgi:glycine hydroxymethyltransferase